MSAAWRGAPERGSAAAMALMARLTLGLGRGLTRCLLPLLCLYYYATAPRARRASREFLARALGRQPGMRDGLRHFHAFASTLHDRLLFAAGRHSGLDIAVSGTQETVRQLARGRGCLLVGSHLGSFEVLRACGPGEGVPPINILMYVDNAGKLNSVLRALAPDAEARVIPLGSPEALLRVHECLARGEIVGILGDRAWRNERTCRCEFLGGEASFPLGPLLLAGLVQAPVVLFFGIYRGGRRYDVHLEPFADAIPLERRNREESVRPWVERYARRLEHHCRAAPYNWFNFYDYWA